MTPSRDFDLPDVAATAALARRLAALAHPGDVIALHGDLGAGKTTFARAFIAARGDGETEVPSPTFTLVQVYDLPSGAVWHFDLYRLKSPDEVWELGFEEALASAVLLIEWPERLGPLLPAERLDVSLAPGGGPNVRHAHLSGGALWEARLSALTADA